MQSIYGFRFSGIGKGNNFFSVFCLCDRCWAMIYLIDGGLFSELQIFRTNGFGGMQSDHRFNISTFSDWMSQSRETCKLAFFVFFSFYLFIEGFFSFLLKLQTLSHCELITDDGIRQLAAGSCAAESLSVLELDNCPLITDATLDHLISCHNLQRIELYDCQLISRVAIRRLRVSGFFLFVVV